MIRFKIFNNILVYIILFFTIFGSAYNYTYFPSFLSYLKDFAIYFLFFQIIAKGNFEFPKKLSVSFYALFLVVLFFSELGFINCTEYSILNIFIIFLKYIEFFISFFVFTNIEKITTLSLNKIINKFIEWSVFLFFLHLFGYFVPNNIVSTKITTHFSHGYYNNRISIGQPAIAVFPMILSFIYLLIFENKNRRTNIFLVILLLGIILSVSTTGIISIVLSIILILFSLKKELLKKILKIILSIVLLVCFIFPIIITNEKLNNIYEKQTQLLNTKIKSLYSNNVTDLSMETRDTKYYIVSTQKNNILEKIFGTGVYGYNRNGINIASFENTYRTFLISYGYIGITLFLIFIFSNILKNFHNSKSNKFSCKKEHLFLFILFIVIALHSWTLEIIYIPTIYFSFSLFYCYMQKIIDIKIEGVKKNENINC